MINRSTNSTKRLQLSFELAFQIIYFSIISICFSLAIINFTTLQGVNWYTIILLLLGILLVYFERGTYVTLSETMMVCTYFKGIIKKEWPALAIQSMSFYHSKRNVVIKLQDQSSHTIYLNRSNQHALKQWAGEKKIEIIHLK